MTDAELEDLASAGNFKAAAFYLLLFDKDGRGPADNLRLHFETLAQLPDEDKNVIKALIEGLIDKHRARADRRRVRRQRRQADRQPLE